MSPLPITKVTDAPFSDGNKEDFKIGQDMFQSLFPFLEQLYGLQPANKEEKTALKNVWVTSKTIGKNQIEITSNVNQDELSRLTSKGFLEGRGKVFTLTQKGSKLLKDSILNDEECSFRKEASKKLIAKNSYDFGDRVLVKVHNKDVFGTKYLAVDKNKLAQKDIRPIKIENYDLTTRNEDGSFKKLDDYSDEELIEILHLSKRVLDNSHSLRFASDTLSSIPVHKISAFAEKILHELNTRK